VMHIREGATENTFLSHETYLNMFVDGDYTIKGVPQRLNVKPYELRLSERLNNDFFTTAYYNNQPVTVQYSNYIFNAKKVLLPSENGEEYLKIVESGSGQGHEHWIKKGEVVNIHGVLFAFNFPTKGAVNISLDKNEYVISAPFEGSYINMTSLSSKGVNPNELTENTLAKIQQEFQKTFYKDSIQPLALRSLYTMANMQFVIPEPVTRGVYEAVKVPLPEKTNQDALTVTVHSNGESQVVQLIGGKGVVPNPTEVEIAGLKVYLSYGSKVRDLPFDITLRDFIADKYPGTEKGYSAYRSKVTVVNEKKDFFDYDIFMNNVLDYKGYRFFQASFDPDEAGTILSVNHDFWGTWVTYIGYFLLYIGLMAILFDKNTRFADLKRMLDKVKAKKAKLVTLFLLFFTMASWSQQSRHVSKAISLEQIDSTIIANTVDKEHAAKFGRLVIQDNGRMKPIHTFSSELLRKISGKDAYNGMDANQVFLSILEHPFYWLKMPVIKLDWRNDSIKKVIGVSKEATKTSLIQLFDHKGNSKIAPYLETATNKNTPNQFEKDFIKLYDKSYLLNQAVSGSILKIFPVPEDPNNTWITYADLSRGSIKKADSSFAKEVLPIYIESLREARKSGNYTQADKVLDLLVDFQKKNGNAVMLSEEKINAEILYNKANIFNRLYHYFSMFGGIMFIFIVFQIFNEKTWVSWGIQISKWCVWGLFFLMTAGLVVRWYVSGHAPWSDAYESVLYVSWATVFFGLAFGRKSDLTVASTAFVASILLWVAHLSWLDPAISNLQPVLDSYWLMIHVAVIVASYGPFTLGWILGITSLLLMVFTTEKNKVKMSLSIKEITIITEMALTVGLIMLTIGNFLGGQWANESWGRYWGWDPKETWALISIMVYAFVIHARLVPGLRGRWTFNFMAIIAFASIMMTYFGVNFYLTGLHSYASGDVPVTPSFVYYLLGFIAVLSVASFIQYKKHYKHR